MWIKTLAILGMLSSCCFVVQSDDTNDHVEFKILNQVFAGEPGTGNQPNSTVLTLFQGPRVFDFRFSRAGEICEIVVFDNKTRGFTLLDVERKIRLKVDNLQLMRVLDGMRNELKESPKVQHLLFEDVQEFFDDEKQLIEVASDRIKYEVEGHRPEQDLVLAAYLRFLDNYTLLGVTDPRRIPPFARMRLNRAIKKYGIVPSLVKLTTLDSSGQIELLATSRHRLELSLTKEDRSRIELARKYWVEFRQVDLTYYRSIDVADGQADEVTVKK